MTALDSEGRSGKVIVLGAGFSRAISEAMPLTDELGNLCLRDGRLRSDPRTPEGGFTGGRFETWLSQLADDQPYRSAEENLECQALFLRFSAAIAQRLGTCVEEVLSQGMPEWLYEFLRLSHYDRSTILTFNYDPLVECGVATELLREPGRPESVQWTEVIGNVPNWAPGVMRWAAERVDTFRLLKLHGSLNWYWVPGDRTGASMSRRPLPGKYGEPDAYNEEDRRRELPGRVPFVVPPSATKSAYYQHPMVREVWAQAAGALRDASDVTLIGYSLPSADLTFASLLVDSLVNSSSSIEVVDVVPEGVRRRLLALGISEDRVSVVSGGGSPIVEFVDSWRDATARRLAGVLDADYADQLQDPLLVFWSDDVTAVVVGMRNEHTDVVLLTEEPTKLGLATQGRTGSMPPLVLLRELLDAAPGGKRLVVQMPDGERQALIAATVLRYGIGAGRGVWTALMPSGRSPIE